MTKKKVIDRQVRERMAKERKMREINVIKRERFRTGKTREEER